VWILPRGKPCAKASESSPEPDDPAEPDIRGQGDRGRASQWDCQALAEAEHRRCRALSNGHGRLPASCFLASYDPALPCPWLSAQGRFICPREDRENTFDELVDVAEHTARTPSIVAVELFASRVCCSRHLRWSVHRGEQSHDRDQGNGGTSVDYRAMALETMLIPRVMVMALRLGLEC
jgi:hypothetical protein